MIKTFSRLTQNSKDSIRISGIISRKMGLKVIQPLHLFIGLLVVKEGIAARVLSAMGIDIDATVGSYIPDIDIPALRKTETVSRVVVSTEVKGVLNRAYNIAKSRGHVYVGTEHMLLALIERSDLQFVRDLEKSGARVRNIQKTVFEYTSYPPGILSKKVPKKPGRGPSAIEMFGTDLTSLALQGALDPLVGRDDELEEVINILSRRKKNNPVIVGEAGVGKTALVEGLAQRIAKGDVPESLRNTRIISLDITGILAGSKMRGDMEEKMMAIIREVSNNPNAIVFIDEIHTILGAGQAAGGSMDIAGILKPALVNGSFRCIGATTVVDYSRYFEEDAALSRRFQKVDLMEDSVEDSIKILKRIRGLLEEHHNVVITDEAIESAVKLSDQYVSDRYLPDKAIDLMDEASAARRLEVEGKFKDLGSARSKLRKIVGAKERAMKQGNLDRASKLREDEQEMQETITEIESNKGKKLSDEKYKVNSDLVRKIISRWTGIPLSTLGASETSKLISLDRTIGKLVIGQKEAVEKVSNAIKRARTGITDVDRPWASFLFLGPTGVGKTELAKVLTKTLFGDEDRLVQVDMSEFMETHSVSKLIGSPPGYVGYTEGGQLTEKIRRQPHSVILFDEIEKAHVDVLNILLQILEYGHLTDGKGRKVNFKNTVIILTSNIGAGEIKKDEVLGFDIQRDSKKNKTKKGMEEAYEKMRDTLTKELKNTLPPELLNRLDDVVIFRALDINDAKGIVNLLVDELNGRLEDQGVTVGLDQKSIKYIANEGFSEEYGARPLRRIIQDELETEIASYILKSSDKILTDKKKKLSITLNKSETKLVIAKGK